MFFATVDMIHSQQQMKVMTYNLLNYPSQDTNIRNPHFRTVISSVNPDILVVCEITSLSGVNSFLSNVLNYGTATYSAGFFINGFDTDNAIFFKTSKFNFISNTPIRTSLRDINQFKIVDKLYNDTLLIYALHLKAGDTSFVKRGQEIDSLRRVTNQLPSGTNFLVVGDFNIYGSTEPAYQKLKQDDANNDGHAIDPINLTGTWNNFAYAPYHTQSTRVRAFGDGATGGLDDRFDMILYSNAVNIIGGIKFIPGTYIAYGNDGNHFNDSINQIPNTAVSINIANALHYASDHLPVFASFEFGNATPINIRVIPEGLYNPITNRLEKRDTITVYLCKTINPFNVIDSAKGVIDSVSFNASLISRIAKTGTYYIVVKHRNSIETWSKPGGVLFVEGALLSYDFTTSISQAYGNNLVLKGIQYCIYSGDVDQDGIIDAADLSRVDNDAFNSLMGYLNTDLNGDNFIDASDLSITDNNIGVIKLTP